jgi:hypothetical protein
MTNSGIPKSLLNSQPLIFEITNGTTIAFYQRMICGGTVSPRHQWMKFLALMHPFRQRTASHTALHPFFRFGLPDFSAPHLLAINNRKSLQLTASTKPSALRSDIIVGGFRCFSKNQNH